MNYVLHPAAAAEHLESVAYYESKRPGIGALYLAEFEQVMAAVCESSQRYPVARKPDVRLARMKKFPFTILFRESAGSVQILAVAHHRRRPQYWLGRV
ncbi:MAG: type II toxin-antitoxin system RelE/ParE family toxin [Deltaproteobacteria bacterium]|nr:type II toxin-antitoxin system RelE/ParE family toxin [Candidatus Tharpella sp.]